jgi:hypothetical protein
MARPPSPRKRGRPSKGDRDAFLVRPPAELGRLIRENAADWSDLNEYLTWLLANALDRPDLGPAQQEVLPLRTTA